MYSPHVTKSPAGLFSEAGAACLFLSSNTSLEYAQMSLDYSLRQGSSVKKSP